MSDNETYEDLNDVPFGTTEQDYYAIHSPVAGDDYPDEVSLTYNGSTYTFTDFVTVGVQSKVRPDVLLFERCIVE